MPAVPSPGVCRLYVVSYRSGRIRNRVLGDASVSADAPDPTRSVLDEPERTIRSLRENSLTLGSSPGPFSQFLPGRWREVAARSLRRFAIA